MKASSDASIQRNPSIEREPRTLSSRQLQRAREAALYTLNTKTLEEAVSIFTEGLQPVVSLAPSGRKITTMDDETEQIDRVAATVDTRLRHPLLAGVKDVVSAPF